MKLLTARQLAKEIGISYRTVLEWTAAGVIPIAIHECRIFRYDIEEVRAALAKRAAKKGGRP
jgi:predicted site-specific integrase-resolvase